MTMNSDVTGTEIYFIHSEELDHNILDAGDYVEIKHTQVSDNTRARILDKRPVSRIKDTRYDFVMPAGEDDMMHLNYRKGDSMKLISVYGKDLHIEIREGRKICLSYSNSILNNVINSSMGYDIKGLMVFFHDYAGHDDFPAATGLK